MKQSSRKNRDAQITCLSALIGGFGGIASPTATFAFPMPLAITPASFKRQFRTLTLIATQAINTRMRPMIRMTEHPRAADATSLGLADASSVVGSSGAD